MGKKRSREDGKDAPPADAGVDKMDQDSSDDEVGTAGIPHSPLPGIRADDVFRTSTWWMWNSNGSTLTKK